MSWSVYLHYIAKDVKENRGINTFPFRFQTLARRKRVQHDEAESLFLSVLHTEVVLGNANGNKEAQNVPNSLIIKAETNRKRFEKVQTLYLGALWVTQACPVNIRLTPLGKERDTEGSDQSPETAS